MNVRLGARSIRCRLEPEEARRLLAGERQVMELALAPDQRWRVEVALTRDGALAARLEGAVLELSVPEPALEAALAKAPSKDAGLYGTQAEGGLLTELAVEIDVMRRRRA